MQGSGVKKVLNFILFYYVQLLVDVLIARIFMA
jgi:hypothetical protein